MLVDGTHAIMNYEELKALPTYSTSLPTGTTVGKRWKRDLMWYCRHIGIHHMHIGWALGEYIDDPDPNMIGIRWRRIILI